LESVIDRFFELLPAPDIPFRGLHGRVPEKKLNFLEFATRAVAKACTRALSSFVVRAVCVWLFVKICEVMSAGAKIGHRAPRERCFAAE
jgi:hypothetical protein